jgi:AcrR family transcriptional regulator
VVKYHHGDLRNVLIQVATKLLATEGVQGLSLRKIAGQAGVSHNAPYMHFADKEAVLAAVAEAGFQLLATEVAAAIDRCHPNDTRQQLIAASRAYVRFAIDRPHHLQVMFSAYDIERYPDLLSASETSLNRLFDLVEAGQTNGTLIAGNPHEMTKAIWSMVHGLASISIAYQTSSILPERDSIEDVATILVNHLLDGMAIDRHQTQ